MAKAAIRWGPRYRPVFVRPDGLDLEFITKLIEEGELRPVVDRVFKLEDARCFCHMLRSRFGSRVRGRVIHRVACRVRLSVSHCLPLCAPCVADDPFAHPHPHTAFGRKAFA